LSCDVPGVEGHSKAQPMEYCFEPFSTYSTSFFPLSLENLVILNTD
jgi:hypothetical protein